MPSTTMTGSEPDEEKNHQPWGWLLGSVGIHALLLASVISPGALPGPRPLEIGGSGATPGGLSAGTAATFEPFEIDQVIATSLAAPAAVVPAVLEAPPDGRPGLDHEATPHQRSAAPRLSASPVRSTAARGRTGWGEASSTRATRGATTGSGGVGAGTKAGTGAGDGEAPRGGIVVLGASYGPAGDNHGRFVASECNGRAVCAYLVNNRHGDPFPNRPKEFSVTWRCGKEAEVRRADHGPVVNEDYLVSLSCR